jgi:phage terminase large subunit
MSEIILPYNYEPRNYQLPAWEYMEGNEEGKRAACVWHRRAGKDLFAINLASCKAQERIGTYWHLLPTYKQGRAIVWNGFTRDGRAFLDHFHPKLIASKNSTEMRITFTNGAHYQVVGTDDINSLVGTNPIGCIFSEYSLHDPGAWEYIRPILAENGGWAIFIYTARGKNHGYKLLEMAKKNPKWFSQVLVAGDEGTRRPDGTPVISDEIIKDEREAGMLEAMVQQEFFCSFEAPLVGAYYGPQMEELAKLGRITSVPHDPKLGVDTYWDLGMDDSTTIWFVQEYGFEKRIIDYYSCSGEGLAHYVKVLRGQSDKGEHRTSYAYGKHWAPWDIEVRELGTGVSRWETAKSMGLKFNIAKKLEVEDGIEAARNLLPMCWFDETRCSSGIEALKSYRKDYDEKNKTFRSTPLHDWSSHGADAFRTLAVARRRDSKYGNQRPQERALDEHDYLSAS